MSFGLRGLIWGTNQQAKAMLGGAWAKLEKVVEAALERENIGG